MRIKRFFPASKRKPNVLTTIEIKRLLKAPNRRTLEGLRDAAILETLYASGLRVSELCNLWLRDVDLKNQTVFTKGKGAKERYSLIGRACAKTCEAYLKKIRYRKKVSSPHFFIRFKGKCGYRLHRQDIGPIIRRYCFQVGISKRVTAHTFRHSFATHLFQRAMDIENVQKLLGHSNLVTTQVYVHIERAVFEKTPKSHRLSLFLTPDFPAHYNRIKIAAHTQSEHFQENHPDFLRLFSI